MGKDLSVVVSAQDDRVRYRRKVRRCLDVLRRMLDDVTFDTESPTTGLEIELNLMDSDAEPAMCNAEILGNLADPRFQTELGQFNLELNAIPRLISGNGFADYELDIVESLAHAEDRAGKSGCTIVLIGCLPTLRPDHLVLANLSANERYRALNDQIVGARGEHFSVDIRGVERLQTSNDSIAPEAACTSVQFHLRVPRDEFAAYWNASQAVAEHSGGGGCELAVPARAAVVGRDPDRPVRAGHRHQAGRAEGAGGTAAGVVRRALDRLGARPVRGERAVLPAAAADHRRRGPGRDHRGRRCADPR
nr:hypothetical protein GCM10020092_001780 [Actinoplanes digitatis]